MQKISLAFFSFACLMACSQGSNKTSGRPEQFDSKYVRLIDDTSKMMMIGNVRISYGDLYVESDSAFIDKPNRSVTAFGIKNLIFKRKEIDKKDYKSSVKYNLGDSLFYTD